MTTLQPLRPEELRWTCDPDQFDFRSTVELEELDGLFGQERAETAIEFGVGMRRDGYNLYVLGPPGSGKRTVMRKFLEKRGRAESPPSDWCYVNNFQNEDRPKVIQLPAGSGGQLDKDLTQLVDDMQSALPAALEAEEHRRKVEQAAQRFQDEHGEALEAIANEARESGLEMIRTPNGIALAPVRDGEVIDPKEFEKLAADRRKAIEETVEKLQPKIQEAIKQVPQLKKLARETVCELNREATRFAIAHLLSPLRDKYAQFPNVVDHLDAVEADVIECANEFRSTSEDVPPMFMAQPQGPSFDRYLLNLLVDNASTEGAPVVYEDYPHYHNLVGRIEHESHMGSLITDYSLIKAGSLHRANGGYLFLQARDVLMQPFAWEALKRALRSRTIQMESLGTALSLVSTISLQPEAIPLEVKVVLLGDRFLYYLLQEHDPDFDELFKVAADFNDETDCTPANCNTFARMLATLAKGENVRPLDRCAVALIIEQAARQVGDREKLSTHMRGVTDLLRESEYWAGLENTETISAAHVQKSIQQQIYRSDRIRERVHEEIRRGTLLVDTSGERVGQVNGLSVISLGNLAFGRPSRITATARLGRGKVVDIEREVELGGSIHSKGVLILSSLLAARYANDYPLSLSASVVFEQSYGMVDGDSASVAELCALLSVLADLPIKQNLAITGSLNQHGAAQAIGGVNEKVEGFFDVCSAFGLTGDQGVLIPAANGKHLMLRQDVVEACSAGKFAVYTYRTVDEAMTLLTGVAAGERGANGTYTAGTVNHLVDCRVRKLADLQRAFAAQPEDLLS